MDKFNNPTFITMLIFMIGTVFFLYRLASRLRFKKELEAAVALQRVGKIKGRARTAEGTATGITAGLEAGVAGLKVTQADEMGEEEMKAQQETREKVKQYFRDKPEEATSLLKVWLAENQ